MDSQPWFKKLANLLNRGPQATLNFYEFRSNSHRPMAVRVKRKRRAKVSTAIRVIGSCIIILQCGCVKNSSSMVHISSEKELQVFNAWDKERYEEYLDRSKKSGESYAVIPNGWQPACWASVTPAEYLEMKEWGKTHTARLFTNCP